MEVVDMNETEWKIDYNGWIITVMATSYNQAKYRAWKDFNKEFGSIKFIDFAIKARLWQ